MTSLEFQQAIDWQGNAIAGEYQVGVANSGSYVGELVFPSSVNGDPVTTITGNSNLTQEQKNQVTSVYIPDTVTDLVEIEYGEGVFASFTNLQTVTFEQNETSGASIQSGTGLRFIGHRAFKGCTSLTGIEIPDTVFEIGMYAFSGCSRLTNITIPANVIYLGLVPSYGGVFEGCTNLTSAVFENPNGWTCQLIGMSPEGNFTDETVAIDATELANPQTAAALLIRDPGDNISYIWTRR